MGEKNTYKQNPPKVPGQSREDSVSVFFPLCAFFTPNFLTSGPKTPPPRSMEPEKEP